MVGTHDISEDANVADAPKLNTILHEMHEMIVKKMQETDPVRKFYVNPSDPSTIPTGTVTISQLQENLKSLHHHH